MTKDDLQEVAVQAGERVKRWGETFAMFYVAAWKITVPVTLILIAGIFFYWLFWQTTSPNEQKADDARVETIKVDANSSVSEDQVEKAGESVKEREKVSQNARKEREKAKETNVSNTSYEEANRQRCLAYPESKECRPK